MRDAADCSRAAQRQSRGRDTNRVEPMSNDHPKVLVTGANGGLGSAVVTELIKLASADEIAISVRDPDAAENFLAKGVRVRRGDFDDPASLDIAFEGAESILVISTRNLDNRARFIQQKNAID